MAGSLAPMSRRFLGSPVQTARRATAVLTVAAVALAALDVLIVTGVVTLPARAAAAGCGGQTQSRSEAAAGPGTHSGLLSLRLADGRTTALVTTAPRQLNHPAVSPDGHEIAFLSHSNGILAQLQICDLRRHTTRRVDLPIPAGNFPLSWDWNGKTLAFLGGDLQGWGADQQLFLVAPSGRNLRQLSGNSPWYYDGATLSPDGTKLALLLQLKYPDGQEPEQLAVLDVRTNRLTRVAGSAQVAEIDAASWSPDGTRLVFSAYRQNPHGGLYVVDIATKRVTPLLVHGAGARAPAWSPDGRSIAFVRGNGPSSSIWLLDLRSGGVRRLTRGGIDVAPAWSPDGKAIVFVRLGPAAQMPVRVRPNQRRG